MRRLVACVLLVVLSASFVGCWDRVELEDIAFVQAIGFDEGPPGYLLVTLEVGVTGSFSGASDTGGTPDMRQITASVVARTALEAISLASLNLGRTLSLQHTALYLFGEELAKRDIRFLGQAIDRFQEVRNTAFVAVARGRAEDILRITVSPVEISPGRFIPTLMQQNARSGLFEAAAAAEFFTNLSLEGENPSCTIIAPIRHFAEEPSSGSESSGGTEQPGQMPPTPEFGERMESQQIPPAIQGTEGNVTDLFSGQIPRIGGGPVEVLGTAVFRGGKMVGEMSGEESRSMLMAKGGFESGPFAIPDPEVPENPAYFLGAQISKAKRGVKVKRDDDRIRVNLDLTFDMTYLSIKSQTDYTEPDKIELVENAFERHIKKEIDAAIQRAQTEFRSDVFGFGRIAQSTFWTWPEWEAFAWQSRFPDAEVVTTVSVRLRHPGREFGPFRVPLSERMQND